MEARLTSMLAESVSTPFISVLIPTYRRPQLLVQVLAACIEQATPYGDTVEIVIIDNCAEGSAENTVMELTQGSPVRLRYVHEARKGLATVRNTALRAARGTYIVFLDDDQLPQRGWLAAFVRAAKSGAKAAFGPLEPLYETPPANNIALVKAMFSRCIPAEDGSEIGDYCPCLGTGNSLFERTYCFPGEDAFDTQFNFSGGEDVWLLTGLRGRGIPFTWVAGARVLEYVPVARTVSQYLRSRRYNSGPLGSCCLCIRRDGGRQPRCS